MGTMKEFKGTKGDLKLQYVSGVCIGIGVELSDHYFQITCNSILPETDEEYTKEKEEIEANMTLYAAAPDLLEALQGIVQCCDGNNPDHEQIYHVANNAIKKALGQQKTNKQ